MRTPKAFRRTSADWFWCWAATACAPKNGVAGSNYEDAVKLPPYALGNEITPTVFPMTRMLFASVLLNAPVYRSTARMGQNGQ